MGQRRPCGRYLVSIANGVVAGGLPMACGGRSVVPRWLLCQMRIAGSGEVTLAGNDVKKEKKETAVLPSHKAVFEEALRG